MKKKVWILLYRATCVGLWTEEPRQTTETRTWPIRNATYKQLTNQMLNLHATCLKRGKTCHRARRKMTPAPYADKHNTGAQENKCQ